MAARALITGATGLLGDHVVRRWDVDQYEPVLVRHEEVDLITPGVPTALVERYQPAVVLHLAWTASGTPGYRTSLENEGWLAASLELARACDAQGAWFLATGTSLDDVDGAADAYSSAKRALRGHLDAAIVADVTTWLQPFYVVDVERRRPALVAESLAARDRNVAVELRDPASTHDFILASDVGRAIVEVVRHGARGLVPIGSGTSRPVHEVVERLGATWVPAAARSDANVRPQNHRAADVACLAKIEWSPTDTASFFGAD